MNNLPGTNPLLPFRLPVSPFTSQWSNKKGQSKIYYEMEDTRRDQFLVLINHRVLHGQSRKINYFLCLSFSML